MYAGMGAYAAVRTGRTRFTGPSRSKKPRMDDSSDADDARESDASIRSAYQRAVAEGRFAEAIAAKLQHPPAHIGLMAAGGLLHHDTAPALQIQDPSDAMWVDIALPVTKATAVALAPLCDAVALVPPVPNLWSVDPTRVRMLNERWASLVRDVAVEAGSIHLGLTARKPRAALQRLLLIARGATVTAEQKAFPPAAGAIGTVILVLPSRWDGGDVRFTCDGSGHDVASAFELGMAYTHSYIAYAAGVGMEMDAITAGYRLELHYSLMPSREEIGRTPAATFDTDFLSRRLLQWRAAMEAGTAGEDIIAVLLEGDYSADAMKTAHSMSLFRGVDRMRVEMVRNALEQQVFYDDEPAAFAAYIAVMELSTTDDRYATQPRQVKEVTWLQLQPSGFMEASAEPAFAHDLKASVVSDDEEDSSMMLVPKRVWNALNKPYFHRDGNYGWKSSLPGESRYRATFLVVESLYADDAIDDEGIGGAAEHGDGDTHADGTSEDEEVESCVSDVAAIAPEVICIDEDGVAVHSVSSGEQQEAESIQMQDDMLEEDDVEEEEKKDLRSVPAAPGTLLAAAQAAVELLASPARDAAVHACLQRVRAAIRYARDTTSSVENCDDLVKALSVLDSIAGEQVAATAASLPRGALCRALAGESYALPLLRHAPRLRDATVAALREDLRYSHLPCIAYLLWCNDRLFSKAGLSIAAERDIVNAVVVAASRTALSSITLYHIITLAKRFACASCHVTAAFSSSSLGWNYIDNSPRPWFAPGDGLRMRTLVHLLEDSSLAAMREAICDGLAGCLARSDVSAAFKTMSACLDAASAADRIYLVPAMRVMTQRIFHGTVDMFDVVWHWLEKQWDTEVATTWLQRASLLPALIMPILLPASASNHNLVNPTRACLLASHVPALVLNTVCDRCASGLQDAAATGTVTVDQITRMLTLVCLLQGDAASPAFTTALNVLTDAHVPVIVVRTFVETVVATHVRVSAAASVETRSILSCPRLSSPQLRAVVEVLQRVTTISVATISAPSFVYGSTSGCARQACKDCPAFRAFLAEDVQTWRVTLARTRADHLINAIRKCAGIKVMHDEAAHKVTVTKLLADEPTRMAALATRVAAMASLRDAVIALQALV